LFSGKGVWDGLGGILKQWLRTRIVSAMSYDPNSDDPDPFEAVASVRARGRVDMASDCFLVFRANFELGEHGKTWRAKKVAKGAAITSMFFHWVSSSDIAPSRAAIPVHESVVGISTCYQFFVDRLGHVLIRRHSCWCAACSTVATGGPKAATCPGESGKVPGCRRAEDGANYEWSSRACSPKTGGGAGLPDLTARGRGHGLAATLAPGSWVLVEAYADKTDELWLGKTVVCSELTPRG